MSESKGQVDQTIDTPSVKLGPRTSHSLLTDPKHLVFLLSRYKFCAKMLEGRRAVLEVGCGDAFGTPIVAKAVEHLFCLDREPRLIEGNKERLAALSNVEFHTIDIVKGGPERTFDGAYSLDVIEHLLPETEDAYMTNICRCLAKEGVFIIGTPNVTAERYASEPSSSPHVNLKRHDTLRALLNRYFVNTFIFSMNDEVVHSGFYPMAHYLLAMGVGRR